MDFSIEDTRHADEVAALFGATFTASEGSEEGALIADLARRMMTGTEAADLRIFTARQDGELAGAILFSPLVFGGGDRTVFLLAPVAVAPSWQGRGVGQGLIAHGLDALRREGADIALTYGDPAFYGRVGFRPVSLADIPAPYPLGQPEGWLGQSLTGAPLAPLAGPVRCVAALDDPAFW